MTVVMYERVGLDGRRPSPYSWRIRLALAHKGIDVDYRPVRFADVDEIMRLSGQRFVPIIVDGDRVVHDSWHIATYLEDKFPEAPALFGDQTARALSWFVNQWSETVLLPAVHPLIAADFVHCLALEDQHYYRTSRETRLGMTLEAAQADWEGLHCELSHVCAPLERMFAGQGFIAGDQPRYADYIVFSVFQWARLGCPRELVDPGSALAGWRSRMVALFDGLADAFPGYPGNDADENDPLPG
jgi:glutathione S-transferase